MVVCVFSNTWYCSTLFSLLFGSELKSSIKWLVRDKFRPSFQQLFWYTYPHGSVFGSSTESFGFTKQFVCDGKFNQLPGVLERWNGWKGCRLLQLETSAVLTLQAINLAAAGPQMWRENWQLMGWRGRSEKVSLGRKGSCVTWVMPGLWASFEFFFSSVSLTTLTTVVRQRIRCSQHWEFLIKFRRRMHPSYVCFRPRGWASMARCDGIFGFLLDWTAFLSVCIDAVCFSRSHENYIAD